MKCIFWLCYQLCRRPSTKMFSYRLSTPLSCLPACRANTPPAAQCTRLQGDNRLMPWGVCLLFLMPPDLLGCSTRTLHSTPPRWPYRGFPKFHIPCVIFTKFTYYEQIGCTSCCLRNSPPKLTPPQAKSLPAGGHHTVHIFPWEHLVAHPGLVYVTGFVWQNGDAANKNDHQRLPIHYGNVRTLSPALTVHKRLDKTALLPCVLGSYVCIREK